MENSQGHSTIHTLPIAERQQTPSFIADIGILCKWGIVSLVLVSTLLGYFAGQPFDQPLSVSKLLLTLAAVFFLGSGTSALNQIQEVALDARMKRTANRPLPSGRINLSQAWIIVAFCLSMGLALCTLINLSVVVLGFVAFVLYNVFYTLWWKPRWAFGAVPGAIPGAIPILMGYAASSGNALTAGGAYLFLLQFYWQMPHFWAIALKFKEDYAQGGVPTLPVSLGLKSTIEQMIVWTLGYVALALGAPLFFDVGAPYIFISLCSSVYLLWALRRYSKTEKHQDWLRFFIGVNISLVVFIGAIVLDLWSIYLLIP